MKQIIILVLSIVLLTSCGVGSYTVSSGKANEASISFTDTSKYPIMVLINGTEYNVETVKTKAHKTDRNIKKTALNTITLSPGQHTVKVVANGQELFNATLLLSISEHRIIEL